MLLEGWKLHRICFMGLSAQIVKLNTKKMVSFSNKILSCYIFHIWAGFNGNCQPPHEATITTAPQQTWDCSPLPHPTPSPRSTHQPSRYCTCAQLPGSQLLGIQVDPRLCSVEPISVQVLKMAPNTRLGSPQMTQMMINMKHFEEKNLAIILFHYPWENKII